MSLIINLFGSPCSGKSSLAAGLFFELKLSGYDCELVTEFAKRKVWEKSEALLNQPFISINQYYDQELVRGQVDCIITDSPILLGAFYMREKGCTPSFIPYLLELFNTYTNLNFMLKMGERMKENYNSNGRIHKLHESLEKQNEIEAFLQQNSIPYTELIVDGRQSLNQLKAKSLCALPRSHYVTFE